MLQKINNTKQPAKRIQTRGPEVVQQTPVKKAPKTPKPSNMLYHCHSIVMHNRTKGTVTKTIKQFKETFDREIYWLEYLNNKGYKWCPQIYNYDKQKFTIEMEYVGERINKSNAPKNWQEQLQSILDDLKKDNLQHNDIKPAEVLINNGQLYLVDYGWMTINNDWSCGNKFPTKKKPSHIFFDHTAMKRIEAKLR